MIKPSDQQQAAARTACGAEKMGRAPGLGDTASREIDNGWRVRHTDLEFLISAEARDAVRHEGIVIIDYRVIKDTWPHEQGAR